jgi:hypothetical protein
MLITNPEHHKTHKLIQAIRVNHAMAFAKPSVGVFSCSLEGEESESYANAVMVSMLRDRGMEDPTIMELMCLSYQEFSKLSYEVKRLDGVEERFAVKKKLVNNWLEFYE